MRLDLLSALNVERSARRAAIVVTRLDNGEQRLVKVAEIDRDSLKDHLERALRRGQSQMLELPSGKLFLDVHLPPPRLVITGAVHISQALAPMARTLGYDVAIIDPRTAFANPERFPGFQPIAQWPEVALPPLAIDRYTALATLTHDPKIDDFAILHALSQHCFYVGALGSRKTHARRIERLKVQGASEAMIVRIHAPIGLPIGAATPQEIAIAILAQITSALRQPGEEPA